MKTLNQYLTESLLIEATRNDPRLNPPKFTAEEKRNNRKLFQHVVKVIEKERDYIAKAFGKNYSQRRADYQYTRAFNLADNGYYRTEIAYKQPDEASYNFLSGIELITDSKKNEVRLIVRTMRKEYAYGDLFETSKQIVKKLRNTIERALNKIADNVKLSTIDSGRQYGFVYKMTNPDYSKCDQGSVRVASIRIQDTKYRKQTDRIESRSGNSERKNAFEYTSRRTARAKKYEDVLKNLRIYNKLQDALKDTSFVIANFDNWQLSVNPTSSYIDILIEMFALDKTSRQLYRFRGDYMYRIKEDEKIDDSTTIGEIDDSFKLVPTKAKLLHPAGWYSKNSIDKDDLEKQIPPRKVAELLAPVVKKITVGQIKKLMKI